MSQATGCVVSVFVTGSNTAACKFVFEGRFPDPETITTLPLCRSAACTGLMGMRFGSVCHCPCTLAWADAEGAWVKRKAASTANTTERQRLQLRRLKGGIGTPSAHTRES